MGNISHLLIHGFMKNIAFLFYRVLFAGLTDVALRCLFNIQDNTNRFPNLLHELANPEGLKYPLLKTIACKSKLF